ARGGRFGVAEEPDERDHRDRSGEEREQPVIGQRRRPVGEVVLLELLRRSLQRLPPTGQLEVAWAGLGACLSRGQEPRLMPAFVFSATLSTPPLTLPFASSVRPRRLRLSLSVRSAAAFFIRPFALSSLPLIVSSSLH